MPADFECEAAEISGGLNLMNVFGNAGVSNEFDPRVVESDSRKGNSRGDIRVLARGKRPISSSVAGFRTGRSSAVLRHSPLI